MQPGGPLVSAGRLWDTRSHRACLAGGDSGPEDGCWLGEEKGHRNYCSQGTYCAPGLEQPAATGGSSSPHHQPLTTPTHRRGNGGTAWLSDSLKVAQVVSAGVGTGGQAVWTPMHSAPSRPSSTSGPPPGHAPSASRPAEVGTTQGAPRVNAARRQSSAMLCPWTARHLVSAALLWSTTTASTWRHSTASKALCNHRRLRTDVTTRRVGGSSSSSSSTVQVRMGNPKGK